MARSAIENAIIEAVRKIERRSGRAYAWMVQAYLDFDRCEQTIRKDMVRLAKRGELERLGPRKGYKTPQTGAPRGMVAA